jgi:hypothetical protein
MREFETLLKLVGIKYEDIFKLDFVYDQDSLLKIYNKRKEHLRGPLNIHSNCQFIPYIIGEGQFITI